MTSTALERAPDTDRAIALFPGATPAEILAVAADVATQFSDVVKRQRMFKRIGDNDHIQIEAWQTIGALTGVVASEGAVTELPWPAVGPLGDEPPIPGREPRGPHDTPEWRAWKLDDTVRREWEVHAAMLRARDMGRAYGFKAEFHAVKGGAGVGWGEGRCTRGEASKVGQEDYALASMAQTRAQSRALGAPLKFVVKLAGYETTPAEELDGTEPAADAAPALPYGPVASDKEMEAAAASIRAIAGDTPVEAEQFVVAMGQHFDGVPTSCVTMLRGLARYVGDARTRAAQTFAEDPPPENAPPDQSAYSGPSHDEVYPPGRYQGD